MCKNYNINISEALKSYHFVSNCHLSLSLVCFKVLVKYVSPSVAFRKWLQSLQPKLQIS